MDIPRSKSPGPGQDSKPEQSNVSVKPEQHQTFDPIKTGAKAAEVHKEEPSSFSSPASSFKVNSGKLIILPRGYRIAAPRYLALVN